MITSEIKVYNIYYENVDELGIFPTSSDERLTIKQAEEILIKNDIEFTTILKVRVSHETISLPIEIYEKYKK